ncbi:uncharacterized protein LOC123321098 [Coccinella septempunctata]|uniref:uncharacterized protein LOC123321098 n=1 Tax=Coccinella septempunctata TaxID=41139 RepID=UPI001D08C57E|nr:uncharacterized protein LOC123321098 [Coccinella septempunctata]
MEIVFNFKVLLHSRYICNSNRYQVADNFELAQKKLKLAELTSDLQTDSEDSESITLKSKRKVTRPIRFDSDEEYSENFIPRPPSLNNLRPNIEAPNDHRYEAGSASAGTSSNYSSKAINICKVRELTHDSIRPAKELIINGSEAISKSAFEILLTNLLEIKQQNKKILNLLDQKESLAKSVIPDDLPVTFPLKNLDDLVSFEGYLTSKSEGAHAIMMHENMEF